MAPIRPVQRAGSSVILRWRCLYGNPIYALIYGGNLPTTPWTVNNQGKGPAWSNSLFEDNAEFGLGMRLTLDKQQEFARELLTQCRDIAGEKLVSELLNADQSSEAGIKAQRERVALLKERLQEADSMESRIQSLLSVADALVRKSVWIIGGDGWAYDIGFGGLDHVLASGRNVNVLVLDKAMALRPIDKEWAPAKGALAPHLYRTKKRRETLCQI